ncbi:hypothetical protein PG985_014085 [Apiospora marii]|uniref:uncharacterized protein n=1 Tax=Apiospora marii TaxID=335849 RepID=UPI003130621B
MLSNTLSKTLCWVLGAGYSMKLVSAQNPPAATITQAPETAPLTGDLATQYKTLSGITENTLTTTVVNGTSTILPIWYCAPTESAEACKNCPTHTASPTASCSKGFNALLLLPPLALAGLWIPPPSGLPTLTIEEGKVSTRKRTRTTERKSTRTRTTTTEDEDYTLPVSCLLPSLKIADHASQLPATTYFKDIPPTTTIDFPAPIDRTKNPMPVLKETADATMDPTVPTKLAASPYATARLSCGGPGDPYFSDRNFYQYGNMFSRTEGLNTVSKFCKDLANENAALGPEEGVTLSMLDGAVVKHEAIKVYKLDKGESGEERCLAVRAFFDFESRMQTCVGKKKPLFPFNTPEQQTECYNHLGQTIDYCNTEQKKPSTDKSWKMGGTFYKGCVFWDTWLASTCDPSRVDGRFIDNATFYETNPGWQPAVDN